MKPLPIVFTAELVLTTPLTATISYTALLLGSATKTLPIPSTATPWGKLKPLPTMFTVELELTTPAGFPLLPATISLTALWPGSATKTSPLASTATPVGEEKPLPIVFTVELALTTPAGFPLLPATISYTVLLP